MKTNLCSPFRQARPVLTARISFRFAAHVVLVFFAAGVLTASLHAQRGAQPSPAPPPGPRPATAPPLVPVRLDVDGNFRIAPPYAPDPAFSEKPNVPKGQVIRFTMNSAESKLFPTAPVGGGRGARAGGGTRRPNRRNSRLSNVRSPSTFPPDMYRTPRHRLSSCRTDRGTPTIPEDSGDG